MHSGMFTLILLFFTFILISMFYKSTQVAQNHTSVVEGKIIPFLTEVTPRVDNGVKTKNELMR